MAGALPQGEMGSTKSGGAAATRNGQKKKRGRSEEHTSELQSHVRISYAVFCLKKKKTKKKTKIKKKKKKKRDQTYNIHNSHFTW